jgi:hypothetical protein
MKSPKNINILNDDYVFNNSWLTIVFNLQGVDKMNRAIGFHTDRDLVELNHLKVSVESQKQEVNIGYYDINDSYEFGLSLSFNKSATLMVYIHL